MAGARPSSPKLPTVPRRCLGCGRTFQSWGPANRICDRCRAPKGIKAERYYPTHMKRPTRPPLPLPPLLSEARPACRGAA